MKTVSSFSLSTTRNLKVIAVILVLMLTSCSLTSKAAPQIQPVFLFTPTANPLTPSPTVTVTPSVTPQATVTVTITPTVSEDWVVSEVLEPVSQNGYRYAVLVFRNVGNGATKKGQCQQPAWPMPELGHVYKLVNTLGDYWLFIPIEGITSTYQRFAPIP